MPYSDTQKKKEHGRAYRLSHKAEIKAYKMRHRQRHNEKRKSRNAVKRDLVNAKQRARHAAKREERNAKRRAGKVVRNQARTANDRLRSNLATRLYRFLAGQSKSPTTMQLLGCSLDFLWGQLEKQFKPGMTRDNYGPVWHIDHILPCAEFHLQHSEEREICFHWTNLQPLFAKDNLSKGAKII